MLHGPDQRQDHAESRALAPAFGPDAAAVDFYQGLCEGESDSGVTVLVVKTVEALEDQAELVLGDEGAGIEDAHVHEPA